MRSPSAKTIKQLFALSKNQCAFPKCPLPIVEEASNTVIGEICHIKARSPGGPRYDSGQTDEERHSFENLVLMCSIHGKIIDEDEGSYTVERLCEIKAAHESGSIEIENSDSLERFNQLLDKRIRLIIEHESLKQHDPHESTSGPFALAQKLANQRRYEDRRAEWLRSIDGLNQVIASINEILTGIRTKFLEEQATFETLEISLETKEKMRVLVTPRLGCKVELVGYNRSDYYAIPPELGVDIILFSKRPLPQGQGLFSTALIKGFSLKPDVDKEMKTIWREQNETLTSQQVIEKAFELLLKEIEKGPPLSETVPGGKYLVNDELVDAWGEPIDEDDYLTPLDEGW